MIDTIDAMQVTDVNEVKLIQDSYSYWDRNQKANEREGFFLRLLTRDEINEQLLEHSSLNIVYRGKYGVEAYLMANSRPNGPIIDEKIGLASFYDSSLRNGLISDGYCFAKYVAKSKGCSGRTALKLEKAFFEKLAINKIKHAVGLIALEPYNKTSWDFHTRLGWIKVGEANDTVNHISVKWGIAYKKVDFDGSLE